MKQETKATIAYLAAIIFVIICIALMAVTPAYGQNQTVIKDSKGEVVYVKIKTASGYIVKDKNGVLLYTVVENDTEKRVYDASGRLISVEKKAKSNNFCWNLRYENSHTHQCIGEQLEFDLVDLLCNRIEWIVSNGYELNL